MFREFKEFIARGSVIDLAVGIVIGAAFGKIVTSFVNDLLMPAVGLALGKIDFSNLYINLSGRDYASLAEAKAAGAATINYGLFINTLVDFLIVAFALFIVIKAVNRMRKPAKAEVTTKDCPYCISAIPIKAVKCPQCTSELSSQ